MNTEADKPDLDEDDGPDAEFAAAIRKAIADATPADEPEDTGGFDAPLAVEAPKPTVSQEEGLEIALKARVRDAEGKFAQTIEDGAGTKPGTEQEKPADDAAKSEGQEEASDGVHKPAEETADLTKAPVADLLSGIDAARSAEITRRLKDSSEVLDLFAGKEEALKVHGMTRPHEAIKRLLYLNEFAQAKPDEYVAWLATQVKPDAAHTVIEAAAKRLGYRVVRDEPEEDEFADEEVKRLRRENAELKAKSAEPFGPDAPHYQKQRSVADTLDAFVTERDETGHLRRPHFDFLKPRITQLASAHVQATQKYVTTDDLQRFYDQAAEEARAVVGGNDKSAAQPAKPVQDQGKTEAAQPQKAKAASKMIDGDGPGATRRPALPEGADLMATLRHFASEG